LFGTFVDGFRLGWSNLGVTLDFVFGKVVPVVELVGEHGVDEIAEDIAV
jgi:hypothetical protein